LSIETLYLRRGIKRVHFYPAKMLKRTQCQSTVTYAIQKAREVDGELLADRSVGNYRLVWNISSYFNGDVGCPAREVANEP
jgi:hypothetical protein